MSPKSDRPIAPFGRRAVPVDSVRRIGPYTLIEITDLAAPTAKAGQFHMLATESNWGGTMGGRPFLARAISFISSNGEGRFGFLLHTVGPGTERLADVNVGDNLLVVGPLGNGFGDPSEQLRPILIGGGIGAAPVLAMADQLTAAGRDYEVILGFRDASHAELASERRNCRVVTDDGSTGRHGTVLDELQILIDSLEPSAPVELLACGPPGMLEAVRAFASAKGLEAQLALETPMACGYGACFGCVVPTKNGYVRACVDGPVFMASQLDRVLPDGPL